METTRSLKTADGVTLHYCLWKQQNARPLLILIHGMASNLTRWSEFVEHTTLKQHFDILRVDLRGHAGSFTRSRIGMEVWAQDLNVILVTEGYERAVFVGHSLGANLALHFAARYPARVAGLALIDPVFTEALIGKTRWLRRLSWLLRALVAGLRFGNRLGLRRRQLPQRDLRKLDEQVRAHLLGAGRSDDFVKRYTSSRADLKQFSTAHYLQELIEITRPIPPAPGLQAPLLALISQAVTFTDTAATRATLARYANSEVVMLSAYHWPLTEKPVEVRQAIEAWCARLSHA
jgi:pimeloyl-ACP methyl ester carboxylesterase